MYLNTTDIYFRLTPYVCVKHCKPFDNLQSFLDHAGANTGFISQRLTSLGAKCLCAQTQVLTVDL